MDRIAGSAPVMTVRERAQWALNGFIAGILIGMVLGWMLQGVIGAIFYFFLVAALVVPFVLAWLFWRRVQDERREPPAPIAGATRLQPGETIEITGRPIEERSETR